MPGRKTKGWHFQDPKFQNFLGEHAPRPPSCKCLQRLRKIYSRVYIFKIPHYAPGEGGEGNACRQTPWLFANERRAWLARLAKEYWHVLIKGLFHTERSCMVRDTHIKFLWLLFILDTTFAFQCKSIFFDFFWNAKLFLWLNRSFNLLPKVPPGSE